MFEEVFLNRVVCDHLAAHLTLDGIIVQFTLNEKSLWLLHYSKLTFREHIGVICNIQKLFLDFLKAEGTTPEKSFINSIQFIF